MTRILFTVFASVVLTGGIGYFLIPVLRAMKAGQSIREIGPTWHNNKAGTPMMGRADVYCLRNYLPACEYPIHAGENSVLCTGTGLVFWLGGIFG